MNVNYGTLIDPDKFYPVTYTINQSGKKIYKKGKLKGSDLTENQVKELLRNPKAKIIISHGGKRPGSGRPKLPKKLLKEKTKVMRIPVSKVKAVKNILEN
jgi:hypothetical protein